MLAHYNGSSRTYNFKVYTKSSSSSILNKDNNQNDETQNNKITDNINNINTSDINTMNVLKDAAALAIYGNRASNGVIIISGSSLTTFSNDADFINEGELRINGGTLHVGSGFFNSESVVKVSIGGVFRKKKSILSVL